MTAVDELGQMAVLVNAQYEQEQRKFAALIAQENQLRAELDRLDAMRRTTHLPDASMVQMQAIGADVIWQGWVGRTKTALNIQLAQVLAQKEHHQGAVRKAYGKVLVVQEMRDQAHADAKMKRGKGQLDRAIAQSFLGQ